jgi:DNA-binding MarR family transcriptional regulator
MAQAVIDRVATERPAERLLRQLLRTYGALDRVVQPYFARFGITGSQWGVLRTLQRAENEGLRGLRLRDLGERLLIRPPSVTGVVDRLERAGLVVRGNATNDLRAKRVRLTAEGRRLVDRVLEGHARRIDELTAELAIDEQVQLRGLLERLQAHLEEVAARGGVGRQAKK